MYTPCTYAVHVPLLPSPAPGRDRYFLVSWSVPDLFGPTPYAAHPDREGTNAGNYRGVSRAGAFNQAFPRLLSFPSLPFP